jgi:general L-amino acid transport system substrate-binding protein
MRKILMRTGLLLLLLIPFGVGVQAQQIQLAPPGPTLNAIQSRRNLLCGVNQDLFGFGFLDPNTGNVSGFDVDFCHAIAAAVLGDSTLVSLQVYSTTADGEDALRSGAIDVLMHNVTWTLSDDAQNLVFGPVNFYGGQTIMVRSDSTYDDWPQLDGKTICVVTGSVAEDQVLRYMQSKGLAGNLLSVAALNDGRQALDDGRCDAVSGNVVDLSALRQRSGDSIAYNVWQNSSQFYTHEPFAPVIRADDDQWETIIDWTFLGLIEAEQLGISSETLQTLVRQPIPNDTQGALEADTDYIARVGPEVARFLDANFGIGYLLGLQPNFMAEVIRQVGNYGEIYNRHLGPIGELPIERGLNNLVRNGGLLYAPGWQ